MTIHNHSRINMSVGINCHDTVARWLPKDPNVLRKYLSDFLAQLIRNGVCKGGRDVDLGQLSPVILEFKNVIEGDVEILRDFCKMFEQVRPRPDPNQLSVSG